MKIRLLFPVAVLGALFALGSCGKDSSGPSVPLSISLTTKDVGVDGETFTVDVTSGGTWDWASTYPDASTGTGTGWVKTNNYGTDKGDGQLEVQVTANTTASERSMDIVFSDNSGKQTLHITQGGAPVSFSMSFDPNLSAFGRKSDLKGTVLSNAKWTSTANGNSWITVSPASGNPSTSAANVTISLAANTAALRTGSVTFSAGDQSQTVNITQGAAEANSYIIAPGNSFSVPISQANADGSTRIANTDAVNAQFLWGDMGGLGAGGVINSLAVEGSGDSRSIRVTAGSTPGNAVIAAIVGGTVRWSWHIWVTDFNPLTTGQTYAGTDWAAGGQYHSKKIMDRNLGALSAAPSSTSTDAMGLMYQWGRKDPFPAHFQSWTNTSTEPNLYGVAGLTFIITAPAPATTPNNLEYSIANPATFITTSVAPNDWYIGTGVKNDNLWGDGGDKTAYDPCPPGWRVPAYTVFNDFNAGTSAANFSYKNTAALGYKSTWVALGTGTDPMSGAGCYYAPTTPANYSVYLPAEGLRLYSMGFFANIGSTCDIWSSTPWTWSTSGYATLFQANGSYPYFWTGLSRGMGFPVRCIQQ